MNGNLKVIYMLDDMEIHQYMQQSQLLELLKNEEILLVSVNAPVVKRYKRKKVSK